MAKSIYKIEQIARINNVLSRAAGDVLENVLVRMRKDIIILY